MFLRREKFGFEKSVVKIPGGYFQPLTDACDRWEKADPQTHLFTILYELNDGRFVVVRYEDCKSRQGHKYGKLFEIWEGTAPSPGTVVTAIEAVQLLVEWQESIPKHLEQLLAAAIESLEVQEIDKTGIPSKQQVLHAKHASQQAQAIEEPLNRRAQPVLVAMLELGAFDCDSLRTTREIAIKALGRGADANALKAVMSDLKTRMLAESRAGRSGGCWLTAAGRTRAEKLRNQLKNSATVCAPIK